MLQAGVDPSHYGEVLLAVSARRAFAPSLGAALTEPASQLEWRIRIMLARDQPASIRRAAAAALFVLASAACATIVEPPRVPPAAALSTDADGASRFFSAGIGEIVSVGDHGAANKIVMGPDGTLTLHSPALELRLTDGTELRGSSGGIVKSETSMVFQGSVKFELGGTSVTATRAVAKQTADGRMALTVENAIVVRPPE